MQYHRPEQNDGLVMAFRRDGSPFRSMEAGLRGIDPNAEYEVVRSVSYQPSRPVRMKGTRLQMMHLDIDECPGSVLVEYRRVNRH